MRGCVQVDVDDRFVAQLAVDALLLETDQERPLGDRTGQVGGVPAPVLQEQVLVALETQQRHRLPLSALAVLAEEDRVLALQLGELGREGRTPCRSRRRTRGRTG